MKLTAASLLTVALVAVAAPALADSIPAAGAQTLKLVKNGTPLPLLGAVVSSRGTSSLELDFSTAPLTCDKFDKYGRSLSPGEQYFHISFAPMLQKDGTSRWMTRWYSFNLEGVERSVDGEAQGLSIKSYNPTQGVRMEAKHTFTFDANDFLKWPAAKVELEGHADALGCGLLHATEAPERLQKKLTFTLANQPIPIRGAILEGSPESPKLSLTSSPQTCDKPNSAHDVRVNIPLNLESGETYRAIYMNGDILPSQYNGTADAKALTVKAKLPKKKNGKPVVVDLKGDFDMFGYRLTLKGKVEALDCTQ